MLFIDMDGVIAEHTHNDYVGEQPIYMQSGYYRYRNTIETTKIFLDNLQSQNKKFMFLSAVHNFSHTHIEQDKRIWLDANGYSNIPMLITNDKKSNTAMQHINRKLKYTDILIDDYNPNLEDWQNAGGLAIKYCNGKNNPNTWSGYKLYQQSHKPLIEQYNDILNKEGIK